MSDEKPKIYVSWHEGPMPEPEGESADGYARVITKSGPYFEERGQVGSYVRVEDVAELVRAARDACNAYFCTPQPRNTRDLLGTLEEALKPFEGS